MDTKKIFMARDVGRSHEASNKFNPLDLSTRRVFPHPSPLTPLNMMRFGSQICKKLPRLIWMMLGFMLCSVMTATPSVAAPAANATMNLLNQPPTEVTVSLGNAADELKFVPSRLEFFAGKRYKLLLTNPSPQKHYFTAKDFADVIWTQKVEAGNVEVKGAVHELELKPGAEAEWMFVTLKPGTYSLRCPIAGHTEAGMTGEIAISVESLKEIQE